MVEETRFEQSLKTIAAMSGRRAALRSVGATGMALLTALGVTSVGAAKQDHGKRRRQDDHRAQAERKKRGRRGPAGPTGPTGPTGGGPGAGGTGPTGPTGASGAVSVVMGPLEFFDVDEASNNDALSSCSAGSTAISANVGITNTHCVILFSGQNNTGTAWLLSVGCPDGESSNQNSVEAICLVTA